MACDSSGWNYMGTSCGAESGYHVCLCGATATMKYSKTAANPGRRFYSCANYLERKSCGFFRWVDPPLPDEVKRAIDRLLKEKEEEAQKARRRANRLLKAILVIALVHVLKFVLN